MNIIYKVKVASNLDNMDLECFLALLIEQGQVENLSVKKLKSCPFYASQGLIRAHNHPSGSKVFSHSDKSLTRKFAKAGQVLDISILNHVVLTTKGICINC